MNPSASATSFHIRQMVEYSPFRVVGRVSFLPCLSTELVCLSRQYWCASGDPLHQMQLFFGTSKDIGAVIEELLALVTDQSGSCRGDALLRPVADSPLLLIEEPMHHLPQGQDFYCFPSIGSGTEVDVPLLLYTECFVPCC